MKKTTQPPSLAKVKKVSPNVEIAGLHEPGYCFNQIPWPSAWIRQEMLGYVYNGDLFSRLNYAMLRDFADIERSF